jgi:hypothetical protein
MKKISKKFKGKELLAEYDFSKGIRGKYVKKYTEGTNVVILDPDVVKIFSNSVYVNSILRALANVITQQSQRISD